MRALAGTDECLGPRRSDAGFPDPIPASLHGFSRSVPRDPFRVGSLSGPPAAFLFALPFGVVLGLLRGEELLLILFTSRTPNWVVLESLVFRRLDINRHSCFPLLNRPVCVLVYRESNPIESHLQFTVQLGKSIKIRHVARDQKQISFDRMCSNHCVNESLAMLRIDIVQDPGHGTSQNGATHHGLG